MLILIAGPIFGGKHSITEFLCEKYGYQKILKPISNKNLLELKDSEKIYCCNVETDTFYSLSKDFIFPENIITILVTANIDSLKQRYEKDVSNKRFSEIRVELEEIFYRTLNPPLDFTIYTSSPIKQQLSLVNNYIQTSFRHNISPQLEHNSLSNSA